MKIDEILKKAALEAEKKNVSSIPDDDSIDWTPAKSFEVKVHFAKPFRQRRYIALIASATVVAVSVFCAVPLLKTVSPDTFDTSLEWAQGDIEQDSSAIPNDPTCNVSKSPVFDQSSCEEFAQPEYIPDGYSINNLVANSDGSVHIEYTNGEDTIVFQSGPSELLDISDFEEVVGDVNINNNQGFMGNNINGYINNGIAWSDGEFNYLITNSLGGVTLDELMKIAESVNNAKND